MKTKIFSYNKPVNGAREQRLVFDPSTTKYRTHQPVERYIRTIPFAWMRAAARLPGKTAGVAVALWFVAGVKKALTFQLTAEAVDLSGCSRKPLYRALMVLEQVGLISVTRRVGARPVITIHPRAKLTTSKPAEKDQGENLYI